MPTSQTALARRASTDIATSHRGTRNLRALVVSAIRKAIRRGFYPPGSPLGEVELARRFRVSRGPVREALIQLEREYLVRSFPNRGYFVSRLAEQEFDEIMLLRSVLEPIALQCARSRASATEVAVIRRRFHELERVARHRNPGAYIGKDYNFHVAIWELSGRPLLTQVLKRICAPVFVFESIVTERYKRVGYDLLADARSHRIIVDYLAGKTDLDADACLRPVLDLAMYAEKPIVLNDRRSPQK